MSQHEYEDLISFSIELLDRASNKHLDLRSMFWNFYQFQNMFDTGFTHFRVMEILIKHHYVYQFEIAQHPDYMRHREAYDQLIEYYKENADNEARFREVYGEPVGEQGEFIENGFNKAIDPLQGYYSQGKLHVDAGCPLWQCMVENKTLTGTDTVAPVRLPVQVIVLEIVTIAKECGDQELIKWWYPGLTAGLFEHYDIEDEWIVGMDLPSNIDALRNDKSIGSIREIVRQTEVLRDESIDWRGDGLWLPGQDELEEFIESSEFNDEEASFLRWWFTVDESPDASEEDIDD